MTTPRRRSRPRLTPLERYYRGVSEAELQAACEDALMLYGWHYLHIQDARRTTSRGVPDLLAFKEGGEGEPPRRPIAAELKAETGKETPEQTRWLAVLRSVGFDTFIVRPSTLREFLAAVQGTEQEAA